MTTSQCSKSHPSSRIVSFGGLFDQFGFGSFKEDDVARVAKFLVEADGKRRRNSKATEATGRRRRMNEKVENEGREVTETEAVVERERVKKEARVWALGNVRERNWVAIVIRGSD